MALEGAPEGTEDTSLQSSCIAAVIENRAKEVGIAVLDKAKMQLCLLQLVETSRQAFCVSSPLLPHGLPATNELLQMVMGKCHCKKLRESRNLRFWFLHFAAWCTLIPLTVSSAKLDRREVYSHHRLKC